MKSKLAIILILIVLPLTTFAQEDAESLIRRFGDILQLLIPIAVALAVIAFIWGLAKFIFKAGEESERESGKKIMLWGIIALFVITSIWGIIYFLQGEFGVRNNDSIPIPQLKGIPGTNPCPPLTSC